MEKLQTLVVALCLLLPQVAWGDDPCAPCSGNCGESLGTLSGADAFSNGARGDCTGTGRGFYQCVEYAKRFHGRSGERWGNANQIFGRAGRLDLRSFRNGETEAPRQGDAITFQGGRYGHIAIIYAVGSNFITLIEQNWHNIPGRFRRLGMDVDSGRYTVVTDSRNYTVEGWLRPAADPTTTDDDGDTWTVSEGDCNDANADIHPGAAELCNSLDEDCDGEIDETWPLLGDVCTFRPTPLCLRTGVWACEPLHRGSVCDGDYEIRVERCNYLDDDCDGATDENWPLLGVACTAGWGECERSNVWVCEPLERGIVCDVDVPFGTPELCDELDNDCDGDTDEDWPEIYTACGIYPCDGTYVCTSDGSDSYCNALLDTDEICDGVDNNCDGEADEDWPELGTVCGTAFCRGTYVCSLGGSGSYCNASLGMPEICDDMDNDCDGETDESPAEFTCDDGDDCTRDLCMPPESPWGLCYNGGHDCDGDTFASDIHGGTDCDDSDPLAWEFTFSELWLVSITNTALSPALAWTGSELGLAWSDDYDGNLEIYFARFDANLTTIGSRRIRVTTATARDDRAVSLVWTGSEYGLVWEDYRTGGGDIYFTRLDATGTEIGDEILLAENVGLLPCLTPSIVWAGDEYGVAYIDNRLVGDIYFARLTASGLEIGSEIPLVVDSATQKRYPSMVWTGTEYGLAWSASSSSSGNTEIHFGRFTTAGSLIGSDIVVVSFPTVYSVPPTLVWNGSSFALVWSGYTGDHEELYFTRIDASGVEMGTAVQITTASSPHNISNPVLVPVGGGRGYGLLSQDNSSSAVGAVQFGRYDESGGTIRCPLPYPDFRITHYSHRGRQAMVWTGHEYIFAWADSRYSDYVFRWTIYLGRLGCDPP